MVRIVPLDLLHFHFCFPSTSVGALTKWASCSAFGSTTASSIPSLPVPRASSAALILFMQQLSLHLCLCLCFRSSADISLASSAFAFDSASMANLASSPFAFASAHRIHFTPKALLSADEHQPELMSSKSNGFIRRAPVSI